MLLFNHRLALVDSAVLVREMSETVRLSFTDERELDYHMCLPYANSRQIAERWPGLALALSPTPEHHPAFCLPPHHDMHASTVS